MRSSPSSTQPNKDAAKLRAEILRRFVFVTPASGRWRVGGVGRRANEIGEEVAIVGLKHASSHEVVLRFPDGKLDSFSPIDLFPASASPC
ncbi:hypothetical protein [Oleiharenicola sp. Vm1]|uniref:hypothetical protein n=1 Tax=Oleiharenicola sp. Vm1 TaxID=3398393 RepID=UPI0039F6306F